MKKETSLVLLLIAVLFFFTACKKEETPKAPRVDKTQIAMGDETGMQVVNHDTLLVGRYNYPVFLTIDLDGNGYGDVRIQSQNTGSIGSGISIIAEIICLNGNTEVAGVLVNDTVFVTLGDTSYYGGPAIYNAYFTKYFSCERTNEKDSIKELVPNNFHISNFNIDAQVTENDFFRSTNSVLSKNRGPLGVPQQTGVKGDTTFWMHTYNLGVCFTEIGTAERYFAFKMANSNRLGWIKLSVIDNYKIHLLQTAIQK